jgi:hypothetical protein
LNGIPGAGGFCAAGSVCDRTTLICGAGQALGEACKDGECEQGVCRDGVCETSDFLDNLNCTG